MPPNRSFAAASWLSLRRGAPLALALALALLMLPAACLERPVTAVEPVTSNQFVDEIKRDKIDKIDLLFMIDNSISMADKQEILKQAVPVLLTRLVTPACVDENRNPVGGNSPCAQGVPEFNPIKDIHIGVITSNLGDMGGGAEKCQGKGDGGRLLATQGLRPDDNLRSWNNQGFLAWDPDVTQPRNTPPGMTSDTELRDAFEDMVGAANENGCGYEAVLESWYRFLIDPEPPEEVVFDPATLLSTAKGTDSTILEQRAKFLRHDSLVAVIMLSDENDCSLTDYGRGGHLGAYIPGTMEHRPMPRANSACERDPNDRCCAPCDELPPEGCPAMDSDPICSSNQPYYKIAGPVPEMATYDPLSEAPNLRCHNQKRRFGRDFLQPLSRYVDGLRSPKVYNRRGELVQNPLFAAPPGSEPRDRSLVYLAGITGVPWQDVADEASWTDPKHLKYLTAAELETKGRWDWILGKDGKPPLDPLMFETPYDRTTLAGPPTNLPQEHPAGRQVGGSLASAEVTTFMNPINGHESNIKDGSELQYACVFPLTAARDCSAGGLACDCTSEDARYKRSLCDGTTKTKQTYAKAYPGTRQLQVLRQFGENSIVASICPKVTQSPDPASDPNYGYNPAVNALVDRLKERIGARCLPRPLQVDEKGQVPCAVVEARAPDPITGSCGACVSASLPGRKELAAEDLGPAVRKQLRNGGHCGRAGAPACEAYCLCEVEQFQSPDLERCRKTPEALTDKQGYCYVDDTLAPGEQPTDPDVRARLASIAECPATQRRLLRFSSEVPAKGAVALIACTGKALGD